MTTYDGAAATCLRNWTMPRKVLPTPHEMGWTFVNLTVSSFADPSYSIDTGASHLTLPAA